MKIGYFSAKFPYKQRFEEYSYGGSIVAAQYLALEMAKKGFDIRIFTTSRNPIDSIEQSDNIITYRYGTNLKYLSSNLSIGQFIKPMKINVDIIHAHFDIPFSPIAGLRYVKKKNVPLVVTYHGDWVGGCGGSIRRLGIALSNKYIVDKLLLRADVIISPSKHYISHSYFLEKYEDKIAVIPNGIDLDDFKTSYSKEDCRRILGLPSNKKLILFFGFLSKRKGPDVLLKAMPFILNKIKDAILVFAGTGEMRHELESLSKRLGVSRSVLFMGFIDDDIRPLVYRSADIFVLPSVTSTESFGIVNLEAMACCTPIVASNIGGVSDVIEDGENGLLVAPQDSSRLADAIIRLLEDESLSNKMQISGYAKVKKYSWENVANLTEKIYHELLLS